MTFALSRMNTSSKMQPSTPRTPAPPPAGAGCHYRPPLGPPGSSSASVGGRSTFTLQAARGPSSAGAAPAASNNGVLERDADLAPPMAALGQAQLQSWLNMQPLETFQEDWPLRDSKAHLCLVGTSIKVKERRHAVICVVLRERSGMSSGRNSSAASGSSLAGAVLHWGCTKKERDQWTSPPAGWHTVPDASHDAGGGAWQTPFEEHALGEGGEKVQVMMLQIPMDGPLSSGGIASIVKASGNRWLGNGRTRHDFYFDLQRLPTSSNLPLGAEGAAPVSAETKQAQAAVSKVLIELGSQALQPLDLESLGKAPPAPPAQQQQQQQQHKAKQHAQQPELPNAGRRPPEPRNDETQVCTMSAAELGREAEAQLRAWAAPDGQETYSVTMYEFAVKGHSAPFVVAAAPITSPTGEPQLVVCGVADQGFTGRKVAGLMLQWSCALDAKSAPVKDLPAGWSTEPSYSWDAGDGFWATPFNQHGSDADSKEPKTYSIAMRIPLTGAFRSGGLLFELKTARGQWLRSSATGGHFFLGFKPLAEALLGPLTPEASDLPPVIAADPATPTTPLPQQQPAEPSAISRATDEAAAVVHASSSNGSIPSAAVEAAQAASSGSSQASTGQAASSSQQASAAAQNHDSSQSEEIAAGLTSAAGLTTDTTSPSAPAVPVCDWMVRRLAELEPQAERSLMHRFKLGAELLGNAEASDTPGAALTALAVWLRYSAGRQLTWNKNYNIKPREISAAQSAFASALAGVADAASDRRQLALLAMAAVGRGGQGDVGQRIRDEILTVQQHNNCKGGMMEEWHQKLHNNTSPDDVIICEALLAYIRSDLQISAYWDTLAAHGIDAARLASYDRAVRSEPKFSKEQCAGLDRDLTHYLATLRAVHCGDDLRSAADTVLGYKQHEVKGKVIEVAAVEGVASPQLRKLIQRLLRLQQPAPQQSNEQKQKAAADGAGSDSQKHGQGEQQQQRKKEAEEEVPVGAAAVALLSMQVAAEARRLLQPHIAANESKCGDRLKDVLFLDLALDLAARTALQSGLEALRASANTAPLNGLLAPVLVALQHACLSGPPPLGGSGEELKLCLRQLERLASQNTTESARPAAMEAQSVWERMSRALGDAAESSVKGVQPVAEAVAAALGITGPPVSLFAEDVVRGTTGAALAQLLSAFQPRLRELSGAGPWQIISRQPSSVTGQLLHIPSLAAVQRSTYEQPTILITDAMGGDEDLPAGAVALVVVGICPDVLCHAAVRARNAQVPFVACMDAATADGLRVLDGTLARLSISAGEDVSVTAADARQADAQQQASSSTNEAAAGASSPTVLHEPQPWCGRWVVPASDFAEGVVGAKSLNTLALSGQLPAWVRQPWSLALPQGVFEAVLAAPGNEGVRQQLQQLGGGAAGADAPDAATLQRIREAVMGLTPPPELQQHLATAVSAAEPSSPALEFEAAWTAAKRVWASQWNDRSALALARAGLPAKHLRMSVLVQGVVAVKYAFVAHTTNPTNDNERQVYVDIVRGLGEVLVGGWPGRALSAVVEKSSLDLASSTGSGQAPEALTGAELDAAVQLVAYPSKSVALLLPAGAQAAEDGASRALMMRSDSNAEDLPGFAGAGLFDSHPTMELQQQLVDYSSEPLVAQPGFAQALAWRIALACCHVEGLLGCAQDVEGGVCADGSIVILQARPQV